MMLGPIQAGSGWLGPVQASTHQHQQQALRFTPSFEHRLITHGATPLSFDIKHTSVPTSLSPSFCLSPSFASLLSTRNVEFHHTVQRPSKGTSRNVPPTEYRISRKNAHRSHPISRRRCSYWTTAGRPCLICSRCQSGTLNDLCSLSPFFV